MTAPTCPHDGTKWDTLVDDGYLMCGQGGWLCHACREDRADARADRLTEALAMAALLENPSFVEELWKTGAAGRARVAASFAHDCAAALRADRAEKPPPKKTRDQRTPSPYDPAGMADHLRRKRES